MGSAPVGTGALRSSNRYRQDLHMGPEQPSIIATVANNDVDTMSSFPLFESVPRAELEWLGARGHVQRFAAGTLVSESGSPVDAMWIVLAGRVAAHARTQARYASIRKPDPASSVVQCRSRACGKRR